MTTIRFAALMVVSILSLAQRGLADDTKPIEEVKEPLQGVWKLESMESEGDKLPEEFYKETTIHFTAEAVTIQKGKEKHLHKYVLRPQTDPKQIDFTFQKEGKDQSQEGIYEIKGETLRLCFNVTMTSTESGTESKPVVTKTDRPKKFTSKNAVLMTLSKQKPQP